MSNENDRYAGRVLEAMTLLSVAATAFEIARKQRETKNGRDATLSENPGPVINYLQGVSIELREMLSQIKLQVVPRGEETNPKHRLLNSFHILMLITHVGNHFSVIHQKLMSLYPDVSENLVEETRQIAVFAGMLTGEKEVRTGIILKFADRASSAVDVIRSIC